MSDGSKHNQGLFRVMIIGTAISFGMLAAIMVSMKGFFTGNAAFEFSYKTVIAFAAGAFIGWLFWRIILHFADKNRSDSR
jgi:NhaP-type Na+/H+ or K+/H+ antiporter